MQKQRIFFSDDDDLVKPTDEQINDYINGPHSPFNRFVGNANAIEKLKTAAYAACGKYNHEMNELAFAIFGPSSAGKTTIVKIYAETVRLPLVEISPKSVKTLDDVFKLINNVLTNEEIPLVEQKKNNYVLPPCVLFFDEVHALTDGVIQGLLKATEYDDGVLVTESGKIIDTHHVTWMIATTDEGKLFDAFRTRFTTIQLKLLSKQEVAQIVQIANPDLPKTVCEQVAYYNSRIPREALQFTRYMRLVKNMEQGRSWDEIAKKIATNEGIDEFGMHAIHLKILTALGQGPIARNRISNGTGKKDEEMEKFILPTLLTATDDQPALIDVSTKGYVITQAGLAELDKRGVKHIGYKALG